MLTQKGENNVAGKVGNKTISFKDWGYRVADDDGLFENYCDAS